MEDEGLLIDLRSPDDVNQIILHPPGPSPPALSARLETLLESDGGGAGATPPPLSPLPSPLHGSCLTPRKLISQANSPLLPVRSGRPRLEPSPLAQS